MDALKGKKTYITAVLGILIILVGLVFGESQIAGVTIPQMDFNEAIKYIWEGLLVIFLRKGIAEE